MKITVKTLMGEIYEFTLDANTNIRELRTKTGTVMGGRPWDSFNIVTMQDKAGKTLCSIYSDDDADDKLVDFIRREVKNPDIQVEELTIFVVANLGLGFYRPTKHNPKGISAYANAASDSKNAFFQSVLQPDQKETFSNRLKKIGFPLENVPEKFLDPITSEVMNNPVITTSQRTFDLNILQRLNYIDPNSREPVTVSRPNLQLRSELEIFVTLQEKLNSKQHNARLDLLLENNDEKLENSLFGSFKKH